MAYVGGNPTNWYNGTEYSALTWTQGRRLSSITTGGSTYTYDYDMDGIRTSKTVDGVVHNYVTLNGKVVQESYGDIIKVFIYDTAGNPYAMHFSNDGGKNFSPLYYVLNAQGDVVHVLNWRAEVCATYIYDAWGKILSATGPSAAANPLRYRGYYYDYETGFYYLQSRYYDPSIGRFINADSFASTGQDFSGYNMFVYCNNTPLITEDQNGETPETVFDIISLGASIAGAAVDPWNPWAWLELIGDTMDVVIPCVGGLGEAVGVLKSMNVIDDSVDVAKLTENTLNVVKRKAREKLPGTEYVYKAYKKTQSNTLEYVGITNEFARRKKEWESTREIVPYIDGVNRTGARYAEQTIISLFGRNGNSLSNIRNSIGRKGQLKNGFRVFFESLF